MKLYRAFFTVGSLTMASRLFGFVRDILVAGILGAGAIADAFFAAFTIPNLFRRLFAEGAFNSAFVPLFAGRIETEGKEAARRFAEDAMAVLLAALLVLTAVAEVAMPWLMYLFAPGFADDAAKFDLTDVMTRIVFPYLACMSLVALLSGILNSVHRFAAAAATPILFNIVLIIVLLGAAWAGLGNTPATGIALAWGVTVAGLAQLVWVAIAVRREGLGLSLRWPRMTDGVRRLLILGGPGIVSGGVTQINIWIGGMIATFDAGARSFLYYADRLYQLPLSIVGVAIGVVLLPDLTRSLRAGDTVSAQDSQNRSLELALLLTMPAAVALAAAAEPIVRILFERGAFTANDTQATAWALAAYAFGLPAFVLQKVFQPAFFSREDTVTPMRMAVWTMAANVVGSVGLFFLFKALGILPHIGIAIATTCAGWLNALLLWRVLRVRGDFVFDARLKRDVPRIMLASVLMGAAVVIGMQALAPYLARGAGAATNMVALAGLVSIGFVSFVMAAFLSGLATMRALVRRWR
jgi:putative peptidoglycan lipid II flippase